MESHNRLCMNCFAQMDSAGGSVCPVCGWNNEKAQVPEALPYETVIGTRYLVGRAKAMNGEGLTYTAFDQTTKKLVELQEFFPVSIATRASQGNEILPKDGSEDVYDGLLDAFLSVSKNVSRLKEITVVHTVIDILEENYTAYTVYEYVPAVTLRRYIAQKGVLSWNNANNMFFPILTALGLMNSLGMPHLGISPDTIKVTGAGQLFISGFCIPQVRRTGTVLIDELFSGCAALEQYRPDTLCGESTDVYSFAATLLYAISGALPMDARKRMKDSRLLISKEYLREIPPFVITAIANALQVDASTRTASFQRLKTELSETPKIVSQVQSPSAIRRLPSMERDIPVNRGLPPFVWLLGACFITLVALIILVSAWLKKSDMSFGDLTGFFGTESTASQEQLAPNMLGGSLVQWEDMIAKGQYSFTIRVKAEEFSDTVEEGNIISQTPNFNEKMSEDNVIIVTVSRGKENRALPAIQGMTFDELRSVLENNGFTVKQEENSSDDVVAGSVIQYKDHSEGDAVPFGTEITVIVSTGPAE